MVIARSGSQLPTNVSTLSDANFAKSEPLTTGKPPKMSVSAMEKQGKVAAIRSPVRSNG